MSNTQNKVPGYSKKIPCNETRYFFEKVKGKQFHPKESACDEFTVRLQIRKRHSLDWNAVAYQLCIRDWVNQFHTIGMTSGNSTKLVSTFRVRLGDHSKCIIASRKYQLALKEYNKTKKMPVYDWPIKCLVEKK